MRIAQALDNFIFPTAKFTKCKFADGSHRFELHQQLLATLNAGDLSSAVKLPPGENPYEFVTTNIVFFFNSVNLLFDSVSDFCTPETCPVMSAGPEYKYLWADGKNTRKPVSVCAQQYVRNVLAWTQALIDDSTIFPPQFDNNPPKGFKDAVKNIFKRMFRVYAHLYRHHFQKVVQLGVEPHLNTGFKHFYLFVREYNLVDKRELAPLAGVIVQICQEYHIKPNV
eukprot:TRINITY_DN4899_c0_g1_i1.p1 TRINITY_DN4899_c0_g1~~TRINITY_DN4899_c0_g1_i1.p1  ORF type:complete len:225 (+),score=70.84 TRINITY_DN4899_c0_g1_i1:35-709(+)